LFSLFTFAISVTAVSRRKSHSSRWKYRWGSGLTQLFNWRMLIKTYDWLYLIVMPHPLVTEMIPCGIHFSLTSKSFTCFNKSFTCFNKSFTCFNNHRCGVILSQYFSCPKLSRVFMASFSSSEMQSLEYRDLSEYVCSLKSFLAILI